TDVVGLVALLAFNAASTVCKRLAKRSKRFSAPDKQFSTDSKRFSTDAKQSRTEPKQLLNDAKQLPTVDKRLPRGGQGSSTFPKQFSTVSKRSSTPAKRFSTDPKRFVNADLSQEQIELANQICAGEFGTRPVLRNIIKCIRGGYPAAKPVFDALEQAGEITRDGQRFYLAGCQ
ncbi:hypothetical protein ACL7TT_20220, partial [Microbulbifer sp. 2304DJ12-6]|uniref:hypothetical protein n=1 Tax=Microbulbifer sp. 2304DJ12-6 TaxID=3233340 RepID=UPI0039AEE5F0